MHRYGKQRLRPWFEHGNIVGERNVVTKALGQKYMYYFGQVTKPLFNLNFLVINWSEDLNTSIHLFIKHLVCPKSQAVF